MPPTDRRLLRTLQRDIADTLDRRARAQDAAARAAADAAAARREIAALEARGRHADASSVRRRMEEAQRAGQAERERIAALDVRRRELIGRFVAFDPIDAEDSVPLVLLPVRIETRYARDARQDGDGRTGARVGDLLIRIYPDDLHIDALERGLDESEREPAREYWRTVWDAAKLSPSEQDDAWSRLVEAVGPARAGYVAFAMTPSEIDGALLFPDIGPRQRRPAVARLLPDRFVANAWVNGQVVRTVGETIDPEVVIGLLHDDETVASAEVDGVSVPVGAEWMINFDRAREAGLGVELRLPTPFARIDKLYVAGVRASLDEQRAAKELERLLESHRLSRGLAFVRQGTPTNNTETDRATWQQRPDPARPARQQPAKGSNAAVLADALGVSPAVFAGVPGGERADQAEARAMNGALWHTTWGPFLDRIDTLSTDVRVTDRGRERVRAMFRDYVRGGGPLPAIRIGSQPYGVLPASCLDERVWAVRDSVEGDFLKYLRPLRDHWRDLAQSIPTVATADSIDKVFLDIMGSSAVALGLRVRPVLSNEAAIQFHALVDEDDAPDMAQQLIQRMVLEHFGRVSLDPAFRFGALGRDRPLLLPLVDPSDRAYLAAVIAGAARPQERSVFQALIALAWEEAHRERDAAGSATDVGKAVEYATALPPALREQAMALAGSDMTASSVALHAFADSVMATTGVVGPATLAELQPVEKSRVSFSELALESTSAQAREMFAGAAVGAWARGSARVAEMTEALRLLSQSPASDAERRILVAQTLDLASHRLDAWLTALIERRRAALRQQLPAGIAIGAYAWVEHIEQAGADESSGGYIHAPTMNHARTAGVLRNAYLSHKKGQGGNAFEIKLTSARVRNALEIVDGVRLGQPLGALIGYRIERAIRERARRTPTLRGLPRVILSLRDAAPLVARQLNDRGGGAGSASSEFVAASNVVDGVRLIEAWQRSKTEIEQALNAAPKNNPYIVGAWKAPSTEEWGVLTEVFAEGAETIDAVADLLLAESVHQLTQGNTSASAAALDALGSGESLAPQPEVIRTPARGLTFTHRVMVAFPEASAVGAGGWAGSRPRAQAAPALERWAAARLGPADRIVIVETGDSFITMADAGLAALDVVFEADDPDRLRQRLEFAVPAITADAVFATEPGDGWPGDAQPFTCMLALAGSLRKVLVGARAARPQDFARSGEPVLRSVSAASIQATRTRLQSASDALRAVGAQLANVVDGFASGATDAVQVRLVLERLAAYGVVVPLVADEQLTAVAHLAVGEARRRADEADAIWAGTGEATELANRVARTLFGDGFFVVHTVEPPSAPDGLAMALAANQPQPPPGRAAIRRFLRDVASVRRQTADYAEALLVSDVVDRPVTHSVAQIGPPPPDGPAEWVGGALDTTRFAPGGSVANLVLEGVINADDAVDAMVVDEWTDAIAVGAASRSDAAATTAAPVRPTRATGLALNAAAASSSPPQAILLAICPDGERWSTDKLMATLDDTLEMAKLRAVTLERTGGTAAVLPAIYVRSASLQGSQLFDVKGGSGQTELKYLKEVQQ